MEKIAIRVHDRFQSGAVQKMAFEAGYRWHGDSEQKVIYTNEPIISVENGELMYYPHVGDAERWGETILDFDTDGAAIRSFFAKLEVCEEKLVEIDENGNVYDPNDRAESPMILGRCAKCGADIIDPDHQCPKKVPFDRVDYRTPVRFFENEMTLYHPRLKLCSTTTTLSKQMIREAFEYYWPSTHEAMKGLGKEYLTPAEIEKLFYDKCVGDEPVNHTSEYLAMELIFTNNGLRTNPKAGLVSKHWVKNTLIPKLLEWVKNGVKE